MKTLKLMTIGMVMLFASSSIQAQVSINVNIGAPPVWAPEVHSQASYYYIPDVQCYYDVRATQFIYLNNGGWIRSSNLPRQYRSYDLNRGYKVVLNDYHGSRPYDNYKSHKVKYYKGYKGRPQQSIGHRDNGNHRNDNHRNYSDNHGKSKGHGGGNGHNGKGHKH